jgi:hypothetical protein
VATRTLPFECCGWSNHIIHDASHSALIWLCRSCVCMRSDTVKYARPFCHIRALGLSCGHIDLNRPRSMQITCVRIVLRQEYVRRRQRTYARTRVSTRIYMCTPVLKLEKFRFPNVFVIDPCVKKFTVFSFRFFNMKHCQTFQKLDLDFPNLFKNFHSLQLPKLPKLVQTAENLLFPYIGVDLSEASGDSIP